ncbi:putative PEP-binding protein [Deinococcus cellulosilyticus]|uniref:Phosphoenolpyruvate-protein phosphotransferase n=1 Tax=Deinococcus cellulosilyticus (strain DSM 18568 / NBRC 106333 / KACC 11606 / 5516J-15) TaxID=1223518 RepID=A0A511MVH5_DEIC1|nr:putative PEP-binding protein [Deinococcus cellulosilyticus]GEM44570.1 phosphoenolpyruvate-protein phosphotransferase [Deinococcus cellulosilyticus NBRC 106333 = KACC 11606]
MRIEGTPVMPGIAHGTLWSPEKPDHPVTGTWEDFQEARGGFLKRLETLPEEFRVTYQAIALDPSWDHFVLKHLQHAPLGEAIERTARQLSDPLFQLDDPYLRARGEDILQVAATLTRILQAPMTPPEGSILLAQDVSLLELTEWRDRLSGMLLCDISPTAHVAIIARSFGIPTLIVKNQPSDPEATPAILNAFEGWVEVSPQQNTYEHFPPEQLDLAANRSPVFYRDQKRSVWANINRIEDAILAAELGADGVGLIRTEYLHGSDANLLGLHEETALYEKIARYLHGLPVTVRTLDLGGDKPAPQLHTGLLDQSMLGLRGIRLSLKDPSRFRQHIRAILNGFRGVDLRLMFPFVTTPEEFAAARQLVQEVAGRDNMPVLGMMLEVPAAAFALPEFRAEGCEFISFGTNDLQQYFFASSRTSNDTSHLQNPCSPAFKRLIEHTSKEAARLGLDLSVCGEAAFDPRLTSFWWDLGIHALSVPPALIPWLKHRTQTLGGA